MSTICRLIQNLLLNTKLELTWFWYHLLGKYFSETSIEGLIDSQKKKKKKIEGLINMYLI